MWRFVSTQYRHRVVSYREFIVPKNYALNYLSWNFYEMTTNGNKLIPENLVVVCEYYKFTVNIINIYDFTT